MRFIVMHKVDAHMEAGGPPNAELVQQMGALVQESLKSGVFLNGAGLHRSARRVRLECKDGACTVEKGPYEGKNELVASVAMLSTRSLDDAIRHAQELAGTLGGEVAIEVGPVVEPWDLGFVPKPTGTVPERFLFLVKSSALEERDAEASKKHRAAVQQLGQALGNEGVVLAVETFAPSSQGARLASGAPGKRNWVDGPFSESKELIAGFSLLALPTKADAIAWANRYAAILGDNEVDVRVVNEPPA